MTKLTLKGKYSSDANQITTTLGTQIDELKLKATFTDRTFRSGQLQDLNGVEIGVERPGHFMIYQELQKKVTRFQFHSAVKVAGKPVKLTFVHHHGRPTTTLEGAVTLDSRNKVVVKQSLLKTKPSVKFEHVYDGTTTLEPSYDFAAETWAVSLKQKTTKKGHVKMTYNDGSKRAELEWQQAVGSSTPFKVVASASVTGGGKGPALTFEKEWAF